MSFFNKIKNVFSKLGQKDVNVLDLEDVSNLDRGYENLEDKLRNCGALMERFTI